VTTRDNNDGMGRRHPGSASTSHGDDAEVQAAEQRRLRARRRFLKGGVAGSTVMILTLHHVPVEAQWTDRDWSTSSGDENDSGKKTTKKKTSKKKTSKKKTSKKKTGKKKKSTLMCDEPTWKRKRGVSICTSLNGQVAI
jgi:hypothetical protein